MNDVWELDSIYKGFGDSAFEADLNKLKETIKENDVFVQNLSADKAEENLCAGIDYLEKISLLANKLAGYAMLRQAANTRDPEAASRGSGDVCYQRNSRI